MSGSCSFLQLLLISHFLVNIKNSSCKAQLLFLCCISFICVIDALSGYTDVLHFCPCSRSVSRIGADYQPNTLSRKPAAMAEPITPATFGPMACISR